MIPEFNLVPKRVRLSPHLLVQLEVVSGLVVGVMGHTLGTGEPAELVISLAVSVEQEVAVEHLEADRAGAGVLEQNQTNDEVLQ